MRKKSLILLIVLLVAVLASAIIWYFASGYYAKAKSVTVQTGPIMTKKPLIDLSKINYDAKTTIPGTNLTVSYPKNGYYGNGIKLIQSDNAPLLVFDSIANLYIYSGSGSDNSTQIDVNLYKLEKEKTLEDALNTAESQIASLNLGHYEEVAGTRYFLAPSDLSDNDYSASRYVAYAIVNGRLLAVTFYGGFNVGDRNNVPEIVAQFLSRIDFSCKTDCSINSAPITEEHRGEQ